MDKKEIKVEKAYEKVVTYIREEIWHGNLKRGERLPPERDLAELLGVSRNSVREALRTLSLMGFIDSIQGAGNFVSCDLEKNLSETFKIMLLLGEVSYSQISQLRRGIESETARLAAKRVTQRQVIKLSELAEQMEAETDVKKAAQLDQQFHRLLCDAAGNRLIQALFSAMLSSTVNEFIATMYAKIVQEDTNASRLYLAHKHIVEALQKHDENAAVQAIGEHFIVVDEAINKMQ